MIRCGQPTIGLKEREYVTAVLDSGQFSAGPWVERFGQELGDFLGAPAIPVSSGTSALHLALLACGVGPGDEVIVPATTFIATYNAVLYCGAAPVVADVDEKTWTLDVADLITPYTRAIIPVHLYGVPAAIPDVSSHYRRAAQRIYVIEDCAEALGAMSSGRPVGTLGDVAAFSFYGSKTITTGGEGGAVVTKCPRIAERVRHLAGQAQTNRYFHDTVGYNYRMTELQAAFGCAQLEGIHQQLQARRLVFEWYNELLSDRFIRQVCHRNDDHGYWAFAVRHRYGMDANRVARAMAQAGVETRPIFPPVGPEWPRFAARLYHNGLVLPTHTSLTRSDVVRVVRVLEEAAP